MICHLRAHEVPKDLLLLADPHEPSIAGYLNEGLKLGYRTASQVVGVLVAIETNKRLEVKNLAVHPDHQTQGIGTQLIEYAQQMAADRHYKEIVLGTGNSSLGQLAFYQKRGFRIDSVQPNYFRAYTPPIYENGIRCLDLVVLKWMCKDG